MRDRLEYKMRGTCVSNSIDCEPKNVDASCMDSIDRLAAVLHYDLTLSVKRSG